MRPAHSTAAHSTRQQLHAATARWVATGTVPSHRGAAGAGGLLGARAPAMVCAHVAVWCSWPVLQARVHLLCLRWSEQAAAWSGECRWRLPVAPVSMGNLVPYVRRCGPPVWKAEQRCASVCTPHLASPRSHLSYGTRLRAPPVYPPPLPFPYHHARSSHVRRRAAAVSLRCPVQQGAQ